MYKFPYIGPPVYIPLCILARQKMLTHISNATAYHRRYYRGKNIVFTHEKYFVIIFWNLTFLEPQASFTNRLCQCLLQCHFLIYNISVIIWVVFDFHLVFDFSTCFSLCRLWRRYCLCWSFTCGLWRSEYCLYNFEKDERHWYWTTFTLSCHPGEATFSRNWNAQTFRRKYRNFWQTCSNAKWEYVMAVCTNSASGKNQWTKIKRERYLWLEIWSQLPRAVPVFPRGESTVKTKHPGNAWFSYVTDIGDVHCQWLLMSKILIEFCRYMRSRLNARLLASILAEDMHFSHHVCSWRHLKIWC